MKSEYLTTLRELSKHHSLFAQFWSVGSLVEIQHPRMPTAGVAFDKKSGAGLQFLMNPDFWSRLTDHTKAFVIGHECLHVYFEHGRRSLGLDMEMANVAQDVVINHYLTDVFGFDREELLYLDGTNAGEDWCWRDTVFPDRDDIEPNRAFEYYYKKLQEQGGLPQNGEGEPGEGQPGEGGSGQPGEPGQGNQTVDVHDFMESVDDEMAQEIADAVSKIAEDIMDGITAEEVEDFEEMIEQGNPDEAEALEKEKQKGAGCMAGTMKKRIKLRRVVKKPKWETVVAKEVGRLAGMQRDMDIELWTRPNRRIGALGGDLILPATVNEVVPVRDRVDVWFFQDTSGSCVHHAERFFKAAASIPDDRFRIRMFCFDTKVYETSLESGELFGFGGTKFQPMENEIQRLVNVESCKYPQAVFVITDGDSWGENRMTAEHPERWHWFLTDHGTEDYIPHESSIYSLGDYE